MAARHKRMRYYYELYTGLTSVQPSTSHDSRTYDREAIELNKPPVDLGDALPYAAALHGGMLLSMLEMRLSQS